MTEKSTVYVDKKKLFEQFIKHDINFNYILKIGLDYKNKFLLFFFIEVLILLSMIKFEENISNLIFFFLNFHFLHDINFIRNSPRELVRKIINLNISIIFIFFTCIFVDSIVFYKNENYFFYFFIQISYGIKILFSLIIFRLCDVSQEIIELFKISVKSFHEKISSILVISILNVESLIVEKKIIYKTNFFNLIKNEFFINYHNKILILIILLIYLFMFLLFMINFEHFVNLSYNSINDLEIAKVLIKNFLISLICPFTIMLITVYCLKIKFISRIFFWFASIYSLSFFVFGSEIIISSGIYGYESYVNSLSLVFKEFPKITDYIMIYNSLMFENIQFLYIIKRIIIYKDFLILIILIFLYIMLILQYKIYDEQIKVMKIIISFVFIFNIFIDFLALNLVNIENIKVYIDYHLYKNIQSCVFILILFYLTKFNNLIDLINEEPHIPLRIYFTLILTFIFQAFIFALFNSPLVSFILFFIFSTLKDNIEENKKISKIIFSTLSIYLIYEIYVYINLYKLSLLKFNMLENSLYLLLFLLTIVLKKRVESFLSFFKNTAKKAIIN